MSRELARADDQHFTPIDKSAYIALYNAIPDLRVHAVNSTYGRFHETWWGKDGVTLLYIRTAKDPDQDRDQFYVLREVVYEP